MEKVKEKAKKYEVSILLKGNGYYLARMSLKLGGVASQRPQSSGTTAELALSGLLDKVIQCIDTSYNNGLITTKIDDIVSQRLVQSVNNTGIISPEVMEKTLVIVNKINTINAHILSNISLQTNVVPFCKPLDITNNSTPIIHNFTSNTNKGINYKQQDLTILDDFAMEWQKYRLSLCIATEDNPNPMSQNTIDDQIRLLQKQILPFFKSNKILYLQQITTHSINSLLKTVNGYDRKRLTRIVLSLLFQYAIHKKKIKKDDNPVDGVPKPVKPNKQKESEISCIDKEDRRAYFDMFKKENTYMSILFYTMLSTGIRPEEACGLRYKDIDIKNKFLNVENAYKSFVKYDENGKKIGYFRCDAKLKTKDSYRSIPIDDDLIELLLKHKESEKQRFKSYRNFKKEGRRLTENDYIFLGRTYKPYVSDTLSSALPKLCDKYNLDKITPYTLRHTFATECYEKGVDELTLMHLMGHNSFKTTHQYYINISSKKKQQEMNKVFEGRKVI